LTFPSFRTSAPAGAFFDLPLLIINRPSISGLWNHISIIHHCQFDKLLAFWHDYLVQIIHHRDAKASRREMMKVTIQPIDDSRPIDQPEIRYYGDGAQPSGDSDSGAIEIQMHQGKVQMVWFRCLNLPFVVTELDSGDRKIGIGSNPRIALNGVEYRPAEGAGSAGRAA
jgi:hypothetical protein